ncbi:MAG: FtsX-like permease family protein [Nitrospiraceae bacterium]|nr:FtsX-like permease family protein [Nitrospiraceae bacterium]
MNIAYVAIKNLKRKLARTWLLFAIVAVVSCTLFTATLFLKSINNALKIGTYRLGADILVVPESAAAKAQAALLSGEPTQFLMDRSVLDRVRKVEGVKAATPQLFIKPTSFTCCFNVDVFLVAFDPDTDFTVKPWLEKNLNRKLGINEIITGRSVPVIIGDMIPFFGTNFRVAGTMEPTGMDFFDRAVFMSLDAAYKMAEDSKTKAVQPIEIGRDKISTVLVQVNDDITPDRVAVRIEYAISGVKALVSDRVISTVRNQLSGLIHAIIIISIVLWFIVLLIMAFAFYMIVNERRREIGLLRAMGANKNHISAILLIEASLLSAGGGASGVVFGFGLLMSFKNLMLHYLKLPYLFPSAAELAVLISGAIVFSLATGLLSALLPSLAILKMEPYEAIRREE